MSEQPDLTAALKATEDPFLHGEGEAWDDVFKGEEPFSASFYAEQADEVRAKRAAESDCGDCIEPEGHESARRADVALRGITGRRA